MTRMTQEAVDRAVGIFVAARQRRQRVPVLPAACRPVSLDDAPSRSGGAERTARRIVRQRVRPQDRVHHRGDAALSADRASVRRGAVRGSGAPPGGHGGVRALLAAGRRVRDRGAARTDAPGLGCALRPRRCRRRGRELHGRDRDRGRPIRRLPRTRRAEPDRRRLLQRRCRDRGPGSAVARPRSPGARRGHDHQRCRGRHRPRRRRDGSSLRGAGLARQPRCRERPAPHGR